MPLFVHRSRLPVPPAEAFAWHERPGAIERLTPPWQGVRILERPRDLRPGARAVLSVPVGPFRRRWVAEHRAFDPPHRFEDVQVRGPFARWSHVHAFEPAAGNGCILEDRIDYALPGGPLGRLLAGRSVTRQLRQVFHHRHVTTARDLARLARERGAPCLRVLVGGASGFLGSALVPALTTSGHEVLRLVRGPVAPGDGAVGWDPARGLLDPAALEGLDAVIHLGGESLASGRWTRARKERLRASRVESTALLARTLAGLASPPAAFLCASAIGVYGDRGDETVTEDSAPGTGFLPDLCAAWEAACAPAAEAGIRVATLRLGVILGPQGGALAQMLRPFRLGVGGRLGHGRQVMSWIALEDVVGAILHLLRSDTTRGPVNLVAPTPVTNRAFTRTLGRVLRRFTPLPAPAWALRLAFGEMADAALLAGARVLPARLQEGGYAFLQPDLEEALRRMLGRVRLEAGAGETA